ncbi:MAG: hypothetical protein ACE5JE_09690 [Thermoplasmata archaeon]
MVLEAQVGFVMAVLGLSGCVLFLFERRIQARSAQWLGLFLGVFLYIVVHDLIDTLLLEPAVRVAFGTISSFSLTVIGFLLGGGSAYFLMREHTGNQQEWTTILVLVAAIFALHAAVDGIVVGNILQGLTKEEILLPAAIALQVLHRFLEGGVLVTLMLVAGVRKLRIFAVTFYVGLPMAATSPLVTLAPFATVSALAIVLAYAEASAFFVLLLVALWPALSARGNALQIALWMLVGFLVTLLAHALAH